MRRDLRVAGPERAPEDVDCALVGRQRLGRAPRLAERHRHVAERPRHVGIVRAQRPLADVQRAPVSAERVLVAALHVIEDADVVLDPRLQPLVAAQPAQRGLGLPDPLLGVVVAALAITDVLDQVRGDLGLQLVVARRLRRPERLLQDDLGHPGIAGDVLHLTVDGLGLGQHRRIVQRARVGDQRGRLAARLLDAAGVARGADRAQALAQLIDAGPGPRVLGQLHHRAQQLDVATALQAGQRAGGADRVADHVAVGLDEDLPQRLDATQAPAQARHAQVQHLGGLLAAHVRGLAGLGVHGRPLAEVSLDGLVHAPERLDGVGLAGLGEGAPGLGLGRRIPDAGDLLGRPAAEPGPRDQLHDPHRDRAQHHAHHRQPDRAMAAHQRAP